MTKLIVIAAVLFVITTILDALLWRKRRRARKAYYNDVYLKSDEWQRKRALVLKRDQHRCVHCGRRATQVHHRRYARRNIGREPIEWLESICDVCHQKQHGK